MSRQKTNKDGIQKQKNKQWETGYQNSWSDQNHDNYGKDTVTENQTSRSYLDTSGLSPEDIALGKKLYNYEYKPSAEVQAAKSQMGASAGAVRNRKAYTGTHEANLNDTLNQLMNRGSFNYDFNNDAMYNMYKDLYAKQGKDAAANAAAQAAALTGGYGSSYGTTAAAQANQQYMTQLNNMLPQLQQMARENYDSETDRLNNLYNILFNADQAEYGRYSDEFNRAMDLANFDANQYYNLSDEKRSIFNENYGRNKDLYDLALQTKGVNVNEANSKRVTKYDSGSIDHTESGTESGSKGGSEATTKTTESSTLTSSGSGGGKKGGGKGGNGRNGGSKLSDEMYKKYMDIAASKVTSTSDSAAWAYIDDLVKKKKISQYDMDDLIEDLGIRIPDEYDIKASAGIATKTPKSRKK